MDAILKNFDFLFKTNQNTYFNKEDIPILLTIFKKFREDLDINTQAIIELKDAKSIVRQKLQTSFTDVQQKMFEKY